MVPISQEQLEKRLKLPEGAKGLVEVVISVLEHATSLYKRDRNSFDETLLEPLKPYLDVLIDISEEMAALMKSQSDLCEQNCENAQRLIGDCNAKMRNLQKHLNDTNDKIARGNATRAVDHDRLAELRADIRENIRKIHEQSNRINEDAKWLWVPGYNLYLVGKALHDLEVEQPTLIRRVQDAESRVRSIEKDVNASMVLVDNLSREKCDMQSKIYALEESKKGFEQRNKVYGARIALVSDVTLYYRQLSIAIENIEENLDLPKVFDKLNDITKLVRSTGEVYQDTLKAALIHLGQEYDGHKEHKRLVQEVRDPFKLFKIHERFPREYRLATVAEVIDHRQALVKAMPGWEIAHLADGSVEGALYGGSTSLQVRNDLGHKLAIKQKVPIHLGEEYDGHKEHNHLGQEVRDPFKLFKIHEQLPREYRLATVAEVNIHRQALFKAMPSWEIAHLADGSVDGALYGGSTSPQIRNGVGHKLAIKQKVPIHLVEEHDGHKEHKRLGQEVRDPFKLFKIHEQFPREYRLATVAEVNIHRQALFKAMPSWEIAHLADGSVDGALYGGSTSPQIRNGVGHKLAIKQKVPIHLVEEHDGHKEHKRLGQEVRDPFKLFKIHEQFPREYRLATVAEVNIHRQALFKAMPSWEIAHLADGSVDGALYGGSTSPQIRNGVGHKLGVKQSVPIH